MSEDKPNGRVDMPTDLRPFLVETFQPFYNPAIPVHTKNIIIRQKGAKLVKNFDGSGEHMLTITYQNNVGNTKYKSHILTEGDSETAIEEAEFQDLKSIADIVDQIVPRFNIEANVKQKEKAIYIPSPKSGYSQH